MVNVVMMMWKKIMYGCVVFMIWFGIGVIDGLGVVFYGGW